MLKRSIDTAAYAAMIQEAAKSSRDARLLGEPDAVHYAMRTVLVDVLGYMTDLQYELAIEMTIADILPLLDAQEQDQLEYEYQLEHNI